MSVLGQKRETGSIASLLKVMWFRIDYIGKDNLSHLFFLESGLQGLKFQSVTSLKEALGIGDIERHPNGIIPEDTLILTVMLIIILTY